jgi:hypothetical protein
MCRWISRRVVAFAVAYALALAPVLPLLATLARAADVASVDRGALCTQLGSGSPADVPNKHRPLCPLAAGCSLQGCGPGGVLPALAGVVKTVAFDAVSPVIPLDGETPAARADGAHSARSPPRG